MLTKLVRKARRDGVPALLHTAWNEAQKRLWLATVKAGRPVSFHEVRLRLDAPIAAWARPMIYDGSYEAEEVTALQNHVPQDTDVIELGGGLGAISTVLRSHLNPDHLNPEQAQVTVEAIPQTELFSDRKTAAEAKPRKYSYDTLNVTPKHL